MQLQVLNKSIILIYIILVGKHQELHNCIHVDICVYRYLNHSIVTTL